VERRRVVITGMGILCPTGNTVEEAWGNAKQGKSGIAQITRFDPSNIENKFAGEVKNFDPVKIMGRRDARRADRVTQFALYATAQALKDSGLEITPENQYDIGAIIGTGIGGLVTIIDYHSRYLERGQKAVSPLFVPMMLPNIPSGKIAIEHGLRGPNFAIVTACATGTNSIGESTDIIRNGRANVMLAGGCEAAIEELAIVGFNNMTALSRRKDDATKASRPFDRDRDGFVIAEGAAVLVLEELEHAQARGAKIYAEVLGYGNTTDAHHITAPMATGEGAAQAIRIALKDAQLQPDSLDYINAHGTSTPLNDRSETAAIKKALGKHAHDVAISSTKSVTGHLLGAGGAVEAIFSTMAIIENFVPPTINLDTPDPECDLDYTPNVGKEREINVVMSNSFGFGGHNAVLIFGGYDQNGEK
jgi:3-oxoacyl-[acyl-carrier-protein] synthase II